MNENNIIIVFGVCGECGEQMHILNCHHNDYNAVVVAKCPNQHIATLTATVTPPTTNPATTAATAELPLPRKTYTTTEIAETYGIPVSTVRHWFQEGRVPTKKVRSRYQCYIEDVLPEVKRYLESYGKAPSS